MGATDESTDGVGDTGDELLMGTRDGDEDAYGLCEIASGAPLIGVMEGDTDGLSDDTGDELLMGATDGDVLGFVVGHDDTADVGLILGLWDGAAVGEILVPALD